MNDLGWPWTAKTRSCWKISFYGAHEKNLNKDRQKNVSGKMKAMILVSTDIRYMRIFVGLSHGGASNDNVIVEQSNFHRLLLAIIIMFVNFTVCKTYMHERDCGAWRLFCLGAIEAYLFTYLLTFTCDRPIQPFDRSTAFLRSSNAWPWMNLNSYFSILLPCLSEIIQRAA